MNRLSRLPKVSKPKPALAVLTVRFGTAIMCVGHETYITPTKVPDGKYFVRVSPK
jgi:hypothetical protein